MSRSSNSGGRVDGSRGGRSRGDAVVETDVRGRLGRSLRDGWERTRYVTAEVRASLRHRPGVDRVDRGGSCRHAEGTGTGVHRRIAARRAEVAAGEVFTRRSRALSFALGVALAVAVCALLFLTPILSVRDVEVVGIDSASGVGADAVLRAAGVHEGDNLLLVSSTVTAAGVETVPGIESATVHKTFPGKVRIEVVPRVTTAVTPVVGGYALLDPSATVIEVRPGLDGVHAPVARGGDPTGPGAAEGGAATSPAPGERWNDGLGRQAVAAVAALPDGLLPPVLEAGYEAGALTMTFEGTPKVIFGTPDAIAQKAAVLVSVLADLRARGVSVDYVDVSSPIVPTIRPRR